MCVPVDGLSMRSAIGFAPVPTITGAPNLVRLLTQECVGVTGGLLDVETDAIKAVKGILGHIETKRTGLGI